MDMAMIAPESVSIQRLVMDGQISTGALASKITFDTPARSRENVQTSKFGGDLVDLSGLEAMGEAIRQYRGNREPLRIPESVGRAIRTLVQEVLDGLPKGHVL